MAEGRITAVLGPTNTGKTHYAIERMLAHRTGVIALPLRLLAREVYDRIVKARGPSVVALVTGEERIVPERTQYWVCTTEAMPDGIGADFVAIDEIQLCADPDRGHVFTERLLSARGLHETLFLGSETMRGAIAALVPKAQFTRRERFSTLTWAGSKKTSRMPPRSAIVGFSVDNVYAVAELIRRQKGGCAVVMGALSPRTRNAQVALYQNGDVDYLVATDAIGMGLNLDIDHVAFSATAKFDGRRMRHLFPHEIGQIAGRAGRHTQSGTFGVTGEASPLPPEVIEAVEEHRFAPIQRLQWRNPRLEFGTAGRLIAGLEAMPQSEWLTRGREADDLRALKTLVELPEVRDRLRHPSDVRRLWDVCRIPDFRSISEAEHATLLARIFGFLTGPGHVPDDWLAGQIARIDRTQGDIDALSKRLAFIRTWTYVAQRQGWVRDESHWREATRAVEDRLSDALHGALTQRFVDRRTSVLLRRLKQKESLVAEVNDKGEVTVEGEFAGRLEGFRFRQDGTSSPDEAKMLARAAYESLRPEFHLRADRFYNAPDTEMDFTEQGGLMWGNSAVGKLVKGADPLKPQVEAFVDDEAGFDVAEKVRRRLQHFIDRKVATLFDPLLAMSRDEALTGLARGFAFRLVENLGVLPRETVAAEVKELDQDARGALRKHGVRFGQYTIFQPALLKPAPTRLRLVLWSLYEGLDEFPESPPPGLVTIPYLPEVPKAHYMLAGYRPAGARAIRIDMLERLADILRGQDSRAGFEATPDMLSITGMTLDQFADLMAGLGYKGERGERPRVRPVAVPAPAPEAEGGVVNPIPEEASPLAEAAAEAVAEPETEVFVTFTWAPRPRAERGPRPGRAMREAAPQAEGGAAAQRPEGARREPRREGGKPQRDAGKREGGKPQRDGGKPQGKGGKPQGKRDDSPRSFEARPARVDPDNPFAVLATLRDKI
ncbi:disulfide oxidoreductase [Rhodobacter veldkampii DSM 11550]|uniref:Disulfide oxidoreductase n=1 Tax=Phaeovulum veldkampii DSM 11550 TaxID=1185920 RepID=A0A2T4JBF7_9RHOB|nr:helicase-related protein [Phaeovulum veldkampii]MBK5946998.1 disulfide oxidoreductase [Phaeovulum veldkampii DSM 11550]PTE15157.1 disulfide oxidoreductase [Phaeovulum veldkampii DSM 11550]TDQ55588.1 ATP-dependent RNA helicase SUPV3L1/SUV3 [Phaeovulum veldkampii DSM 11550]